jgi:outer membrane protein OmpA-like peptidoglycan-associated protein
MTGHRIALAVLLVVGLASWAGANWIAYSALSGWGPLRPPPVVVGGAAGSPAPSASSAASGASELRVVPVGGPPVVAGSASASAPVGTGSATAGAPAPSEEAGADAANAGEGPVERLPFGARSPNFRPATRSAIFTLVRRLKEEPTLQARLVGHGDPTSDGPAAEGLALRRAEGVRQFMVTLGIAASRLTVEVEPVTTPSGDPASPASRTVDVFVE